MAKPGGKYQQKNNTVICANAYLHSSSGFHKDVSCDRCKICCIDDIKKSALFCSPCITDCSIPGLLVVIVAGGLIHEYAPAIKDLNKIIGKRFDPVDQPEIILAVAIWRKSLLRGDGASITAWHDADLNGTASRQSARVCGAYYDSG